MAVILGGAPTKYIITCVGGIIILLMALSLGTHDRLFFFFLALFALGIPFNLGLKFFYRQSHLGGAMGVDITLCFLSTLFLCLLMTYDYMSGTRKFLFDYNRTLLWAQLICIMAGILSLANAADSTLVAFELLRMAVLLLIFLVIMNLQTDKQLKVLIFFLSLGVFVQGVLAVYQYKTGRSLGLTIFGEKPLLAQNIGFTASRATGTIGHPNILAYYFEILVPLVFAMLLVEKQKILQLWYFMAFAMGILGMLTTLSRAGWLTVPVSMVTVFIFVTKGRLFQWKTIFQIFVGVLLVGVLIYFFYPTIEKRYLHDDYGSAAARLPMNRAAISVIKQYPIAGVGLNNLAEVFQRYDTTGGATLLLGGEGARSVVHNLYLATWADVGTVGFLAFVWLFLSMFLVAGRLYPKVSRWRKAVLVGISAGIMAQLVHGFFDPGFKGSLAISYLVYALFGIVGALYIMQKRYTDELSRPE